ncbi:MAG: dephospho-CoA kinase [Alphaproteobacteria bacterium]|nr:dephospho-CoA kinase [Alphaproteobacteria bacterium]
MRIIGLTGSIGMGKSTASRMLRRLGIPVHDADAVVHRLLERGGRAVPAIAAAFPGVVRDGAVDRAALGARVFSDTAGLRKLEGILHPEVRRAERRFLRKARMERHGLIVLDIPLLFETKGYTRCDAVFVLTAPAFLQTQRVMKRPGMSREKLDGIRARQTPDSLKVRGCDFVIPSGLGHRPALRALLSALAWIGSRPIAHRRRNAHVRRQRGTHG